MKNTIKNWKDKEKDFKKRNNIYSLKSRSKNNQNQKKKNIYQSR